MSTVGLGHVTSRGVNAELASSSVGSAGPLCERHLRQASRGVRIVLAETYGAKRELLAADNGRDSRHGFGNLGRPASTI